jgi:hypothetical protein
MNAKVNMAPKTTMEAMIAGTTLLSKSFNGHSQLKPSGPQFKTRISNASLAKYGSS